MTELFVPDFSGDQITASGRFQIRTLHPMPDGDGFSALLSNSMVTVQAVIPCALRDDPRTGIDQNATVMAQGNLNVSPRCIMVEAASPVPASIDLLPENVCPAGQHKLLMELIAVVQGFHPYVQRFVELALTYQDQYERFLALPASNDCHHAFQGGLLKHSLEVVSFVKQMPPPQGSEEPIVRDFVLALGLLHDLGKCYAGLEFRDGHRPGHDKLTLKALSMALSFLGEYWPEAVEFTNFVFGRGWRQPSPSCSDLTMIRLSDQISASNDARSRAFADLPELFRFAPVEYADGSRRTFRRLLPPRKPVLY